MKALSILYDASGFVHTAMGVAGNEDYPGYAEYVGYKFEGYPLGGVKFIMRHLCYQLSNNIDVAVMFDSSTNRRQLLPGYKAGRPRKIEVVSQLDFLYEELQRCGIPAYKVDGYEADDLLFSAAQQLHPHYSKVALRAADYDIAHSVSDKIVMQALNSNVNDITRENFEFSLVKGKRIKFNTISAYKTFCGDNSDKIPKFLSESGITGEQLYHKFIQFLEANLKVWDPSVPKNPKSIEMFLNNTNLGLTAEEKKLLLIRRDVVFPRLVDGVNFQALTKKDINIHRLNALLNILNDKESLLSLNMSWYTVSAEERARFKKMSQQLRTGEFAADRNMPLLHQSDARSTTMDFREFTL